MPKPVIEGKRGCGVNDQSGEIRVIWIEKVTGF
jgi:hypothetical protein